MTWEIRATAQVRSWRDSLGEEERLSFIAALELLREGGPAQGRPIVERIHGSRYQNMKELRPRGAGRNLRILFMFDPRRRAILLYGAAKPDNGTTGTGAPSRRRSAYTSATWSISQTRSSHSPRCPTPPQNRRRQTT